MGRVNKNTGFTLVELLIAIAIIAVLAAIAIMQLQKFRIQAYDATAKSDLRNAMKGLETYLTEYNTFPATPAGLLASGFSLSKNVSFSKYKVETMPNGDPTAHMHIEHASSPNAWHANYPKEGNEIEIRKK